MIRKFLVTVCLFLASFIAGTTLCSFINTEAIAKSNDSGTTTNDDKSKLDELLSSLSDTLLNNEKDSNKEETHDDLAPKYEAAKKISSKTVGWIYINNTKINYPVVQGNNTYYLNNSYDDKTSVSGSIFLDEDCQGFDHVSMIHGHNMINGSMFAGLKDYYARGVILATDKVYLYDGSTEREYKIFSAFKTTPDIEIQIQLVDPSSIKAYAQQMKDKSHCSCEVAYEVTEKPLLVLNTCVSDGSGNHFIVVAQQQ